MVPYGDVRNKGKVLQHNFSIQAEGGIRHLTVTGVQTCALPISRSIEAPRCWEKGPARPTAIGPVGREQAASAMTVPTRSDARSGPPGRRGARLSSPMGKRNIPHPTHRISTWFSKIGRAHV